MAAAAAEEKLEQGAKYQSEIQSMMYTNGDVRNTFLETSELVEAIVHANITLLAVEACHVAQKRGSRTMSPEDIIFIIRHDKTKVNRITDFLSWKDVRKNAKQASGGSNDADEVVEEEKLKAPKRKKIKLSYDYLQSLTDIIKDDEFDDQFEEDSIHMQEIESRLREADEVTKAMSRGEYMEYAECRQASFTFKKPKKFRDWLNLSNYIDMKPNDEILEILGFIAWEMVCRLTKTALLVKKDMELTLPQKASEATNDKEKKKGKLFGAAEDRSPIKPEHIREAYRRMQLIQYQFNPFHNFTGGATKSTVNIW